MRALLIGAVVASLVVATSARAHQTEAQRSIVVQVEDGKALFLISWTAPSGILGRLMTARASLSSSPKDTLKALMLQHALASLTIELNGKPVIMDRVDSKLTLDTSSLRRHTVTLLGQKKLPASATLVIANRSGEATRLAWSDRSGKSTKVRANKRAGAWTREPISVDIRPTQSHR